MDYDALRIGLLLVVLTIAAGTDLRTGLIYNWLTYPAVLAGVGLAVLFRGWEGLSDAVLGLGVGFVPMFVAFVVGGYGGGDAKLMAAVGALGHWELALRTLMYGLLVGAAIAMILAIRAGRAGLTLRRVGHVLGLAILGRRPADPTEASGPRVRLGVAICVGGYWALLEQHVLRGALWDVLTAGLG